MNVKNVGTERSVNKMIKKKIYPKTERISCNGIPIVITEKLDGSNLCFFKLNDELYIAQRNNIFKYDELEQCKDKLYKGLYDWVEEHIEELMGIRNKSVVCGEWLGMGKINYSFEKRFFMFAKANIDENFELTKLYYSKDLFIYPFESLEIPQCIGIVPFVGTTTIFPNKDDLDELYEKYVHYVERPVEGFVVNINNDIKKYIRKKNGKLEEHFDRGE
jgi:hypothetical protein